MTEIEIVDIPPLNRGEQSLLDFHSVVNVLHVLSMELRMLGIDLANHDGHFAKALEVCDTLLASLHDRSAALEAAANLARYEATILGEITPLLALEAAHDPRIKETEENLRSVFAIMHVRAREILARAATPDRWEPFDVAQLRSNFEAVFAAIEKNSRGRYRILLNTEREQANDYRIDFTFDIAAGSDACMPPVLQDVMRDLIANARKFTLPGGHITAQFSGNDQEIRFVVRDTGCGIPVEEIREVVSFGKRASNVGRVRSMGGGFGLTKAFYVTKQFGGRFWIASEVGVGTAIRLWIPRPASSLRAQPSGGASGKS